MAISFETNRFVETFKLRTFFSRSLQFFILFVNQSSQRLKSLHILTPTSKYKRQKMYLCNNLYRFVRTCTLLLWRRRARVRYGDKSKWQIERYFGININILNGTFEWLTKFGKRLYRNHNSTKTFIDSYRVLLYGLWQWYRLG